ncbi:UDP GlcNAc:a 6 D mannoside [Trichuris trichiura]|uniref:Alpha-1,6-mannosyl-glycoprotein 2-beta-N-acetylglucosaminyltransferase n=1 Tax=Trichuris trichiura TaxID=36087 RepID=A0A077ZBF7_TRITR|nr:UDP GlcNAc:a 6 D mannoside [Trichuris trichiura]
MTNTYLRLEKIALEYGLVDVRKDSCLRNALDVATALSALDNNVTLRAPQFLPALLPSRPKWIIVVQVHDRVDYLKELVHSLEHVRNIGDALLVFSHDVYSTKINSIVEAIKFCRTVQLLYPLRLELFKNFPNGNDGSCSQAINNNSCRKGQLRSSKVASLAQIKHHWWWKAIQVFEHIVPQSDYDGWVLFLEEDNYVSPDLLNILDKIIANKKSICEACEFLVLGNYKVLTEFLSPAQVEVVQWFSSQHNLGLAFKKSLWMEIKKHAKTFCTYNDYNWDWTLNYISMRILAKRWKAILVKKPRVFHIGDCGVHKRSGQCTKSLNRVKLYLEKTASHENVSTIVVSLTLPTIRKTSSPNGAWADKRDHLLCLWYLHSV